MKTRIITGTVIHKGKELDCYIPQILINTKWRNVLQDGSYILKEGYDAYDVCSKCNGEGCSECKEKGFRMVPPKDNKFIAEALLNNAVKKYSETLSTQKGIRKNIAKGQSGKLSESGNNLKGLSFSCVY